MTKTNNKIVIHKQSKVEIIFNCQHLGPKWFCLKVFGEVLQKIEQTDRCPECMIETILASNFTRCSACGKIILPDDNVFAFTPVRKIITIGEPTGTMVKKPKNIILKKIATKVGDHAYLVCGRDTCPAKNKKFLGKWPL